MHRMSFHLIIAVSLAGLIGIAWVGAINPPEEIALIRQRGEIVVATRIGASTYYREDGNPRGLEYDLAKGFADELGVKLRLRPVATLNEAFTQLDAGKVDVIAAGVYPTPEREQRFEFTEAYMQVYPKLVYRAGNPRPKGLSELEGKIEVLAESSHEPLARDIAGQHEDVESGSVVSSETKDLMYRVWREQTDYAITDSNKLTLNQHFYPELRAAFDIGEARGLAWVVQPDHGSLRQAANDYFQTLRDNRGLSRLIERYYGHLGRFDYVGTRTFMRHTTQRLPQYLAAFKEAAKANDLDWRLLAAIGYQESHWQKAAVSPTGVRGLMMLTRDTARLMNIEDRTDPFQSIDGGARFFARILKEMPENVEQPERTWFALAAYNVGPGHLEDARAITETRGGDPDTWADVKANLPLLAQPEWYKRTRHGKARGWEPVRYVENIRKYYQLLRRITDPGDPEIHAERAAKSEGRTEQGSDPAGWRFDASLESAL